ncbi:phosphatase domain-containing protein [Cryobacterium sp. MLB-32]|uniref:App1 family protein n=1 Tax=Cryobacterium sp. MLB-32 TaxID=1529318 RepID=UPI000563D811
MPESRDKTPIALTPAQMMHRAARIEDWLHDRREGFARKRGYRPMVIPFTGYGSTGWVRILCRVLLAKPEKPGSVPREKKPRTDGRDAGIRGWRSFTSVPVKAVIVTIEISGEIHEVEADRGGVVDAVVQVSLTPGWHVARLHTENSAVQEAPVLIVAPGTTRGIVSDVDDTVMVTTLPRPLLAAWNTFVLDEHARVPTPGMAVFLERLAAASPGAPVIYLSTGAWNVAPTLTRFLSRNLYPSGALLLTDWGPTHDRLFRSGREHKRENLRRLALEFPDMRWILIGDDGQHDEAIYSEFMQEFPGSVAAVAIRQLSPSEAVLAGSRSKDAVEGTEESPWVYGPDGSSLANQLAEYGLL